MRIRVTKGNETVEISYTPPAKLSDVLALHGVPLRMPCGGRKSCLKCKVRASGALSPMSAWESGLLTAEEKASGIRFACMAQALGDVEIMLEEDRTENIITEGALPRFDIYPWAEGLGAAVDIGTTTLAAYLYRLSDGALLSSAAAMNPQGVFGADVISRIEKAMDGQGEALAQAVRGGIASLLQTVCEKAGEPLEAVGGAVLAGNTAMMYLLCGENPASIASAPFQQSRYFGEFVSPDSLGLPLRPSVRVYLSRSISAYIGGDITSALLASRFAARPGAAPELLADIGTNGEIALMAGGRLLCCSTAAGPAFEGTGISRGMTAAAGAVYRVDPTPEGGMVCTVIGGAPSEAVGICGSGIVDAVAAMLETGILDETGRIEEEGHPFAESVFRGPGGELAFTLPGTSVAVTQSDIRAVQLAKAAVCAGIRTLLKEAGLRPEEVRHMLIAGGFGSGIRPKSAERIGLIPEGFAEKAVSVGNAAGAGAAMMLLSEHFLHESEHLSMSAETVELASNPLFMEAYVSGMLFGPEAGEL